MATDTKSPPKDADDLQAKAEAELAELEAEELDEATVAQAREALVSVGVSPIGLSPEEAVEKAKRVSAARARAAQVLSRGRTLDAIDAALRLIPDHLHGEFVRELDGDINRKKALGFSIFAPDASKIEETRFHDPADNRIRIGDTILMVIPREEKAAIDAERAARHERKRRATEQSRAKEQIESTGLPTYGG